MYGCVPELEDDKVREDVFDVPVVRPEVCSVTKLVPDGKGSFFRRDIAGVQVASVLWGVLFRADVSEDVCLAVFEAWKNL